MFTEKEHNNKVSSKIEGEEMRPNWLSTVPPPCSECVCLLALAMSRPMSFTGRGMSVLGTAAYLMPTHCLAGKKEKGIATEWMNHTAFQQLWKIRPWPPRTYIGLLKTTIKEKKCLDSKYHFLSTERICFKVCKDSTKYFPVTSSNEIFC